MNLLELVFLTEEQSRYFYNNTNSCFSLIIITRITRQHISARKQNQYSFFVQSNTIFIKYPMDVGEELEKKIGYHFELSNPSRYRFFFFIYVCHSHPIQMYKVGTCMRVLR